MTGTVGILNVGAGDTKLVFDPANSQDCIRAARIVKDMIRRGYALLIEVVQSDGTKQYQRAYDFKEDSFEYIVADFDPVVAQTEDVEEEAPQVGVELAAGDGGQSLATPPRKSGRKGSRTKRVSATGTKAVAVARSAGG